MKDLCKLVVIMIFFIFFSTACQKELVKEIVSDCNCGVVTSNTNDSKDWTIIIQYNCGVVDTTVWHFSLDEFAVGDTVCKLQEVQLSEFECKP